MGPYVVILVDAFGLSETGPSRESNEDAIGESRPDDPAVLERKGYLCALADGVGGHLAGEVASATAVATLIEEYYAPSSHARVEPALAHAVQAANLKIHVLAQREPEYRSMQTTLSALALAGAQAYVAHVGDSRIYHWRGGVLRQLTADHSEVAELVRMRLVSPEALRTHPGRNVLSRTLGAKLIVRPDFARQPVAPGDQFVLCSDGLWSEVDEGRIAEVIAACEPERACRELIGVALGGECLDNVSVQVIKVLEVVPVDGASAPRSGWLSGVIQRFTRA